MKTTHVVEQLERLEDQLQALKWAVKPVHSIGRISALGRHSIVTKTAGLLRGRIPPGRTFQHRLRQTWEHRLRREAS